MRQAGIPSGLGSSGGGSERELFLGETPGNEKPRWRDGVFLGKIGQGGSDRGLEILGFGL
jgi:hypothetical protein